MIFVTVGTHEQQFNRLIEEIDNLIGSGKLQHTCFMQIGYSTYIPKHCKWSRLLGYQDMKRYMTEADIVITHGGPSSFIEAMALGKTPLVVPRRSVFGEHINDHQLEFVRFLEGKGFGILPVYDLNLLGETIGSLKPRSEKSVFFGNNESFCSQLEQEIAKL
ncbi:hypothetical protein C1875_02895 [Eggerthella lenta]|uniref:Glycosyl transferase family 28 C-terminal domain-containing protein n=1 Tax=Eggerthella lenta TaxID=84112 RepID=A0A369MJM6_EGGLN|nr:glycosyltransferase [Eggerthella lenta]RDB72434.1 hypothetical protein C1875_02895 [Eggerthella lenta]